MLSYRSIVLSGIWQSAGWNSIIFIAALSSVDGQLYDAAKVDGANRWQQVIHVELPALVPTIVILLIMNMGRVLSVGFEKVVFNAERYEPAGIRGYFNLCF